MAKEKFDIRVFMASVRQEAGENLGATASLRQAARLLRQKDADFVRAAYRLYLNREADAAGMAAYAPRARTLPGRAAILAALCLSPERKLLPRWLRSALRLAARPLKR